MAATRTVTVRYNSRPTLNFILTKGDLGQEVDRSDPVNVTGYSFQLIVKPYLGDENGLLPDSRAWVDLAGTIVVEADGSFQFALTQAHTALPPGGPYPAEIRVWSGATTNPPTDVLFVNFNVVDAVDLP